MADFNNGDTVRLKSGGPLMTVAGGGVNISGLPDDQYKLCEWFDGNTPKSKSFHKDSIELDNDSFGGLSLG